MSKEIRLAVVGLGRGVGLFDLAVKGFEGIVPTAVCDTVPSKLEEAKKRHPGLLVFEDYEDMLACPGIDAVIVGTPANHHTSFAVKALMKNINVLSEIPSVWSFEEAQSLWDAHLQSRAIYMTGSNPNFYGFIDAAVDLKQKGLFGDPVYVEASYIHDIRHLFEETPWRATLEPIRYCTHSLGPVLRLIEEDLEWVSCFDTGSHINKVDGQHDVMAALFRTRSNVVVRLLVSFINNYAESSHAYRFFTTKGCFERTPQYHTFRNEAAEGPRTLWHSNDLKVLGNWIELPISEMPVEYASNQKATGHGGVDYAMLDAFFKAIRKGLPSPLGLKEGLRMSLPGTFAAESAKQGGNLIHIRYPWSKE